MHKRFELTILSRLTGVVRLRGPDAVKFLQGQLSNDVERLTVERSVFAGYHNPQGRAIALLRLLRWDQDDILAVVPRELASVVTTRLSKYVLRAKVKITDESQGWKVGGLAATESTAEVDLPSLPGAQARIGDAVFVRLAGEPARWLFVSPEGGAEPVADCSVGTEATWRRYDVASGQPQVFAATSEEFVAQMLNLDVLDGIAFDKGCYTGQEVIARAHYRGRVKRRMQRFVSREACQLQPGDSGQLADGRSFKVVLAAQLEDGRCDFLAVAPLVGAERDAAGAGAPGAPVTPSAAAPAVSVVPGADAPAAVPLPLAADQVALPYALPD
jgi:tRNA-modifying protein YgfZ